jgi:peptide/nickel transport system permease protein
VKELNEVGMHVSPPFWRRSARRFQRFFARVSRQPTTLVALIVVVLYVLMGLFGSFVAPYSYNAIQTDPDRCISRPNGTTRCAALENAPPSSQHLFGTDRNGRDVFSRILHGARYTIGLPIIATLAAVTLGTLLGLSMGYLGGWYDEILSRLVDILLSIPAVILALVMLSTIVPALEMAQNALVQSLGSVNIALVAVIVLLYTPIVTRVIRASTLTVRDRGYIEVARLRGESTFFILFREIFPSVMPALAVEASLRFSYAIFLVASLGFLGLGAQPPLPEWGRMVLDARATFSTAPWVLWFPVLAIATLIISVNLLADGLQRMIAEEEN